MKIKGSVSISRNSRDEVNIRIHDAASGTEFVDVSLSLENYALLITGLSRVDCQGEVRGFDKVGKNKIHETRSVVCPVGGYDKKVFQEWLVDNCQEAGWELNTYLGSQNSLTTNELGERVLNYSVVKYVEDETK